MEIKFPIVLEGREVQSQGASMVSSCVDSLPDWKMPDFLLCPYMVGREGKKRETECTYKPTSSMVSLLRRTLILMYWGPILRTSFDLDYLLRKFGSSGGGWGGQITIQFIAKFFPFGQKTHTCVRYSFWIFKASPLKQSLPN